MLYREGAISAFLIRLRQTYPPIFMRACDNSTERDIWAVFQGLLSVTHYVDKRFSVLRQRDFGRVDKRRKILTQD